MKRWYWSICEGGWVDAETEWEAEQLVMEELEKNRIRVYETEEELG